MRAQDPHVISSARGPSNASWYTRDGSLCAGVSIRSGAVQNMRRSPQLLRAVRLQCRTMGLSLLPHEESFPLAVQGNQRAGQLALHAPGLHPDNLQVLPYLLLCSDLLYVPFSAYFVLVKMCQWDYNCKLALMHTASDQACIYCLTLSSCLVLSALEMIERFCSNCQRSSIRSTTPSSTSSSSRNL